MRAEARAICGASATFAGGNSPPSCIDVIGLLVLSALVATNQPTIVGLCRSSCVTIFFLFFGREKQRNFYLFGFNFFFGFSDWVRCIPLGPCRGRGADGRRSLSLPSMGPYPEERGPQSVSGTLLGRARLRAVDQNRGLNVCLPALDFAARIILDMGCAVPH